MRVIFIATGEIALPCLHHLLEHGPVPLALVTQPDRPAGRHRALTAPAVKHAALAAGLTVFQPERIGDIAAELAALAPDVLVVMAYGQLLRKNILALPRLACINLHASLLPRHRGAACIQAAIDAGDAHTGITAMHVARELDAGDIIMDQSIAIPPDETGGSLHDRLAQLAPQVLAETLRLLEAGRAPRIPQDPAAATYIPKLEREDGHIDWSAGAAALERRIRAYHPWPGTYTTTRDGHTVRRLKILPPSHVVARALPPGSLVVENGALIVGCGKDSLAITTVQPDGGKRMGAEDYLRGHHPEHFE